MACQSLTRPQKIKACFIETDEKATDMVPGEPHQPRIGPSLLCGICGEAFLHGPNEDAVISLEIGELRTNAPRTLSKLRNGSCHFELVFRLVGDQDPHWELLGHTWPPQAVMNRPMKSWGDLSPSK